MLAACTLRPNTGSQMQPSRPPLASARRLVIKLGTRVLTHDTGDLALATMFRVVETVARRQRLGQEVLIVSSGAVGLGRDALGFSGPPSSVAERQACAAVGQTRLMGLYEQGFTRLGLTCAQVLLTPSDFADRQRYLALRTTLTTLLGHGIIPIINANDAVSTDEIALTDGIGQPVFGDNDRLSALVATKLDADLLVLLTDVEGVFDRDPRDTDDARLLDTIHDPSCLGAAIGGVGSDASTGGMRTKVEAAAIAARSGCHCVIASGVRPGVLDGLLQGRAVGTWFPAGESLSARQKWLAFATKPLGILHLDPGAVRALTERGASLLAAGVRRVEGRFEAGDVVELRGPNGDRIGRGIITCSAEGARAWAEGSPPASVRNRDALVDRDQLVLEPLQ